MEADSTFPEEVATRTVKASRSLEAEGRNRREGVVVGSSLARRLGVGSLGRGRALGTLVVDSSVFRVSFRLTGRYGCWGERTGLLYDILVSEWWSC